MIPIRAAFMDLRYQKSFGWVMFSDCPGFDFHSEVECGEDDFCFVEDLLWDDIMNQAIEAGIPASELERRDD